MAQPEPAAEELEHGHTPEEIRERLEQPLRPSYLRDFVYGGIDGAITTFAIVAGSMGANLGARTAIILGVANLLADGLSMAAGNYSATKSEADHYNQLAEVEAKHIDVTPSGEREEVRQILIKKGFAGQALKAALITITAKRERWIQYMLAEEYGLSGAVRVPLYAASATFVAFAVCGLIPLLPLLFGMPQSFVVSIAMTLAVFFAIGAWKSRWAPTAWWLSGLETTLIGGGAAAVAYAIGHLLQSLV